jgi:hypothetical protein
MYAFTTGLPAIMAALTIVLGLTVTTGMRLPTIAVPRVADASPQPSRHSTR